MQNNEETYETDQMLWSCEEPRKGIGSSPSSEDNNKLHSGE